MVKINLLPKEEKVARKVGVPKPVIKMPTGIVNYIGIALLIVVVIILSFTHIRQKKTITRLNTNIQETREELKKLEEVVKLVKELDKKRKDLDARIDIIRDLNMGRFEKVRLLKLLSSILPDYCWLQNLEVKGQNISIKGITFSNQVIAEFMRKLQGERTVQNIELNSIVGKDVDDHSVMEFDLKASLLSSSPVPQKKPIKPKKGTTK